MIGLYARSWGYLTYEIAQAIAGELVRPAAKLEHEWVPEVLRPTPERQRRGRREESYL